MSTFTRHGVLCLLSLIVHNESMSVFDQDVAPHPGTEKKRQEAGQKPSRIYPCISVPLMIIHLQSLYNSSEEAKSWTKAFIIKDLSEHYCFYCMKQMLRAIIIIIIYPLRRAWRKLALHQYVIMRCTSFSKGGAWSFCGASKMKWRMVLDTYFFSKDSTFVSPVLKKSNYLLKGMLAAPLGFLLLYSQQTEQEVCWQSQSGLLYENHTHYNMPDLYFCSNV